jgi:hypothetical protein
VTKTKQEKRKKKDQAPEKTNSLTSSTDANVSMPAARDICRAEFTNIPA